MKAVRYLGAEQNFQLKSVSAPASPCAGQVIIAIKAASLCHTELHFADGTLNLGVNDITMGHECAGIITAIGDGVPSTRLGERVVVYYYLGCAKCQYCLAGNEQLCGSVAAQYGFVTDGGLAQFITVDSRNAVRLPENISFVAAAPIACSVTTAVHALKLTEYKKGEWVAIFGVNGVGFTLIQLAKHFELKVIAICRSDAKRVKALKLGADAVVDATDTSTVSSSVRSITGGLGADIIFECVGSKSTIDQCLGWTGALGKRGRLVFIGYQKGDENSIHIHPIPLIVNEQKILGSVGATLKDLEEAISYVENGVVTPVIDSCIPLSEFQSGLDRMKYCKCIGKIVIDDFLS
jgi:alcohol dehydrogenase, propanol-preferring